MRCSIMKLDIKILQLIEKVVDEEASPEEVKELMNFFERDTEYYDYFQGYKLIRKAYPKNGIDK